MTPARGRCLVRKVETAETYAGGRIILPESVRDKIAAQQVEIVAVGQEAECRDWAACERPHVRMGSDWRAHPFPVALGVWALTAPRCLVESGDPTLYFVHQDDVLAILSTD